MLKKVVFSLFLGLAAQAYGQTPNYQTYSLFVYSFTRFVQWPPEESNGDFEIAVLGESPILAELKSMADKKKVAGRNIRVTKINSLTDYKKSQMLYLSQDWLARYPEVATRVGDAPVLLVTELGAGANKGSINFINNKEGKVGFELNQASLAKHRLKASAELTRLAIIN